MAGKQAIDQSFLHTNKPECRLTPHYREGRKIDRNWWVGETYASESMRRNLEINAEVIEGSHPIPSTTPCFCVCVLIYLYKLKFDAKFLDNDFMLACVSDGKICFHEWVLSNCLFK